MPTLSDHRAAEGLEHDEVMFGSERIATRVAELGAEITEYYGSGPLIVLGLLKGSFIFLADLVRHIDRPHHVDFLVAASYGAETQSSGVVRLVYAPEAALKGKHILLVDDIIDTGNTANRLVRLLKARDPKSLDICTLLHKRISAPLEVEPRFIGFDAPPEFLVGYGLDHADDYRHLPYIVSLKRQ